MKQITENNSLIAEFMGYGFIESNADLDDAYYNQPNKEYILEEECGYDSDWNELMPVVDKIEGLGYDVELFPYRGKQQCGIHLAYSTDPDQATKEMLEEISGERYITEVSSETKIQAIYEAVVQFIEWYNKNN